MNGQAVWCSVVAAAWALFAAVAASRGMQDQATVYALLAIAFAVLANVRSDR